MSWKAGFGLSALALCLLAGPGEGPLVRTIVTPVATSPVLDQMALEPLPPSPPLPMAEPAPAPARVQSLFVATPPRRLTSTQAVPVRQTDVRTVRAPGKRPAKTALRRVPRKSPYAIGKAHYPYVRPRAWGPGYPVA